MLSDDDNAMSSNYWDLCPFALFGLNNCDSNSHPQSQAVRVKETNQLQLTRDTDTDTDMPLVAYSSFLDNITINHDLNPSHVVPSPGVTLDMALFYMSSSHDDVDIEIADEVDFLLRNEVLESSVGANEFDAYIDSLRS
jgi:hypothetical protein